MAGAGWPSRSADPRHPQMALGQGYVLGHGAPVLCAMSGRASGTGRLALEKRRARSGQALERMSHFGATGIPAARYGLDACAMCRELDKHAIGRHGGWGVCACRLDKPRMSVVCEPGSGSRLSGCRWARFPAAGATVRCTVLDWGIMDSSRHGSGFPGLWQAACHRTCLSLSLWHHMFSCVLRYISPR